MENFCPKCDNHCPKDQLKCHRGRVYFGMAREEKNIDDLPLDEAVILLLRKCGHYLHHNVGADRGEAAQELLAALSKPEKETLLSLLKKCSTN